MPTNSDTSRLSLIKKAGIPATYFARYCGIHRVTLASWLRDIENAKPRRLYWEAASKALTAIDKGMAAGLFPLPRPDYDSFTQRMTVASTL